VVRGNDTTVPPADDPECKGRGVVRCCFCSCGGGLLAEGVPI